MSTSIVAAGVANVPNTSSKELTPPPIKTGPDLNSISQLLMRCDPSDTYLHSASLGRNPIMASKPSEESGIDSQGHFSRQTSRVRPSDPQVPAKQPTQADANQKRISQVSLKRANTPTIQIDQKATSDGTEFNSRLPGQSSCTSNSLQPPKAKQKIPAMIFDQPPIDTHDLPVLTTQRSLERKLESDVKGAMQKTNYGQFGIDQMLDFEDKKIPKKSYRKDTKNLRILRHKNDHSGDQSSRYYPHEQGYHRSILEAGNPRDSLEPALYVPRTMDRSDFKNMLVRVMKRHEKDMNDTQKGFELLNQSVNWKLSFAKPAFQPPSPANPTKSRNTSRVTSSRVGQKDAEDEVDFDRIVDANKTIIRLNIEREMRAERAKKLAAQKETEQKMKAEIQSKINTLQKKKQIIENLERLEVRRAQRALEIKEGNKMVNFLMKTGHLPPKEVPKAVASEVEEAEGPVMPHPTNSYAFLNMSKVYHRQNQMAKENADLKDQVRKMKVVLDQYAQYFEKTIANPELRKAALSKSREIKREVDEEVPEADQLQSAYITKEESYSFRPLRSQKDKAILEQKIGVNGRVANLKSRDDADRTEPVGETAKLKINKSMRLPKIER